MSIHLVLLGQAIQLTEITLEPNACTNRYQLPLPNGIDLHFQTTFTLD